MGLADFLADAGNRTVVGQVAQAFGGQTSNQRRIAEKQAILKNFTDNQLPALLQEIHANTDETKIPALGSKFAIAAAQAGIPVQGIEKLMEMTIGPALQGVRAEGLRKLSAEYGAQEAQPRPENKEGPLTPSGNFVDPRAEKPLDLNFVTRFGQLTGANPEGMRHLLGTPAEIANKQASTQKTQGEIDKEAATQRAIQGLSNEPIEQGLPSLQQLAHINRAGIVQTLPGRAKPEDPLLEERRGLLGAQTTAANAQAMADRARASREPGGSGGRGSALMQDFVKSGGDPADVEGFMEYSARRKQAGVGGVTETEGPVDPTKNLLAEAAIAKMAQDRGTTDAASLKKIAADMGYELEGNPTVEGPNVANRALSAFGVSEAAPSKLKGNFSLKPKTKTVTKTPSGPAGKALPGQGRYSEGVPSGSAPAAQAGGRGRGQGITPAGTPDDNDPLGIRPKRR